MALTKKKEDLMLERMEHELEGLGMPKKPLKAPLKRPTPIPLPSKPMPGGMPRPMVKTPAGPVPIAKKPIPIPVPKIEEKKELSDEEVAKLPLFMKLEDYDKIVRELDTLVTALKNMEKIMNKLSSIGREEDEQAERWRNQLETTKDQVRLLLAEMPETGKLRRLLGIKRKTGKKLVEEKKKELNKPKLDVLREVTALRSGITNMHEEMRRLNMELQMLRDITKKKSPTPAKPIKKTVKPNPKAVPKAKKKVVSKSGEVTPWGN